MIELKKIIVVIKLILFGVVLFDNNIFCQPSGGPYGPILKKYNLPNIKGKIYYVSPDGLLDVNGTSILEPTNIVKAIKNAVTGDAIILRGGIYRVGDLKINQGVILQPYKDERPIFKGTYIADKWENLGNGLWVTKWSKLFPAKPANWWQKKREGKKTPLHRFNNDMVFIDGKMLLSTDWEGDVNDNTYYIDYENELIYIGINPENHIIEITAFDNAIIRTNKYCNNKEPDNIGLKIYGITFTQYAYRAIEIEGFEPESKVDESKCGKDVVGAVLENCEISYCSRVGGYFRGDSLIIRNCLVKETSTEGIYIIASNDVLLEKNVFTKNNNENITGYYPAAVKIFNQCSRVTCNDNLVIDLPNSNGIWYDVGNKDCVFSNNWVENVGKINNDRTLDKLWPSDNGFFFEISQGIICFGNVFVNCDHGLMVLNSKEAKIYNNTFINSMACIGRDGRKPEGDLFGWHSSTGPDVNNRNKHIFINNLLYGDNNYDSPFLFVWQSPVICKEVNTPQIDDMDFNLFIKSKEKSKYPSIIWSPSKAINYKEEFETIIDFQKQHNNYLKNSYYLNDYKYSVLYSNYFFHNFIFSDLNEFIMKGSVLPVEIKMKLNKTEVNYIGAYSPLK
ncbi:MAG TPA: right-handed parallel beta-helix repeat-containing protein [Ignavibacteria bacterium]